MAQKTDAQQAADNRAVIEVLQQHGDALTQVREIDHFAYFPTPALRAAFIDGCLAAGFRLRATSEPPGRESAFGAIVFHTDIPTDESMRQITSLLAGLPEGSQGEYDGWETRIVA